MKFSCDQIVLSKALSIVSKAVSSRTTVPVLKSILLEAKEDNTLKLSASDLDFSIQKTIDADVKDPGSIAVNAKLFSDIVRKMPEDMYFEVDENGKVSIQTHYSTFNIVGTPASDFPGIADIEEPEDTLSFNKQIFTEMIRKTGFCASIDETRGVLVGILMELEENAFHMVALDGFRMAVANEVMTNKEPKKIVVNAKILGEVNKIIIESGIQEEEDVQLILGDKKAVILLDRTKIVMRLMDGEFINYKEILPKENSTIIEVWRKDFLGAVERASLLAKEGRNNLITCNITDKGMDITSNSEEGNVKEYVGVKKEGKDIEIGFNSKYIEDALKVIEDEHVKMEFNTSITPCLIKPVEGDQFTYLVLPVRIPSR